ncbi:dual specificity protein phosphatase 19 isoform 2-T2 [Macrochelys suwanniensis]
MHSLTQEIRSFSRKNLKKQCTRVTTLTGKRIVETWKDARMQVVEEAEPSDGFGCGYVQDLSLDLQVGVIKPWLLLGSQDAAQDLETMKKYGDGVVLVHCNAGVSRAAAIIIGFLINSEGLNFARAFSWVKNARPAICPNPGFMEQLHKYQECSKKANGSINDHK